MLDKRRGSGRQSIIAGLDIGTTKIACVIAQVDESPADGTPNVNVIGFGHQVSRGINRGTVVDIQPAEEAIRAAVDAAERMAGVVVHKVWVNLSSATMESHQTAVDVPLAAMEISSQDLRRVMQKARSSVDLGHRVLIHAIPRGFSIDGSRGIRDPRGMFGENLGVNMHLVSAAPAPIRNLTVCIKRCHLEVAGLVAAPYASGLSTLVDDEKELGVTLIELGGGTTSVGIFSEGRLLHLDTLMVGANHVTNDLARGLSTTVEVAERLKTLYGSALPSPADDRDMVDVPQLGEDMEEGISEVPKAMLTAIIQPRLEETLEMARDALRQSGFEETAGRRIVLTGGGSQIPGVRELTARILDKPVRVARPGSHVPLPDTASGPAFATCAGLIMYGVKGPYEAPRVEARTQQAGSSGQLARLGRWLRANL